MNMRCKRGQPEMTDKNAHEIARHWQAGETGCGALILGLRREIGKVAAGELLQVSALDAGAPADLPAWCRMTGHTMVAADHPTYVLKKKDG
jgi:tRNA 2-thiouridine synthesizing protein A